MQIISHQKKKKAYIFSYVILISYDFIVNLVKRL